MSACCALFVQGGVVENIEKPKIALNWWQQSCEEASGGAIHRMAVVTRDFDQSDPQWNADWCIAVQGGQVSWGGSLRICVGSLALAMHGA
jgi:hypothetical protein